MAEPDDGSALPTKTVTAPDGSRVHYPNLPNVGEPYQPPNATAPPMHEDRDRGPAAPSPSASHQNSESFRERVMSAARNTFERAQGFGKAALDALVLDDWNALTGAHSTPLQRLEAGADLASWVIPEGKVAEIAGHAIAKASEIAAARLASETALHATASGVEHAAPEIAAIGAARWNRSDILRRPLTESERGGAFKNVDDLKAMLRPAGDGKDWHHIVESNTERRFGAERVHNIDNVVAVERNPTHRDISKAFQNNDPLLGPGPDGREQSLRTYLKDKPWEKHVQAGEQELRANGLDPNSLRAETLKRFEQRLEAHDRHFDARSNERPAFVVGSSLAAERSAESAASRPIHVERNGVAGPLARDEQFTGSIRSIDGDRITQHIGRGETVTWSREELARHAGDVAAFDAAVRPGNMLSIGRGTNGTVEMQQQIAGQTWSSLTPQPSPTAHPQPQSFGLGR